MRARLALGIAAALAVVVLLPVITVVALGAYGSSLGGATVASGPGDAQLLVSPSHGLPGSPLTVSGSDWPPRSNVAIQLQRPSVNSKPLRLAEIITSRRGTFEIDTSIPGSIIPQGTQSVRIQALFRKPNLPDPVTISVPFNLDPYPNQVSINIVDADSGAPSPNALVRIDDSFGQQVASDSADDSGNVSFAGIRPGKKRITIRKVDYQIARASIEVPQSGEAAFEIVLRKSPGKRLLFYAYGLSDTGKTTIVGIDRASGLPIRETVTVPQGRFAPASVPSWNLHQGFFLAVDQDASAAGADSLRALWAMGAAARQLRTATSGFSFGAWHSHLGKSDLGDIVHTFWSRQVPVGTTHLCIVDPASGQIVRRERIAHNVLQPILSSDASKAFLVNWDTRSVDVLELATGERTTIVEDIPLLIAEATIDPTDDAYLILSAATGSVYKLHTPTGELTEIYPDDQLQSVVDVGDDGRLMTSVIHSRDLVVSSLETGQIEAVVPLESHINWLFRDRSGSFIFAAHLNWPAVIRVQVIDSETLKIVDVVEIPNVNDAMRQDGLLTEDS